MRVDSPVPYYNQIVDAERIACPDWCSAETMQRADGRYRLGAVVAHKAPPARPGAGSCIFIHVAEAGQPTAGCTALPAADMARLAGWLAASEHPLLVQLPRAEYLASRERWAWPSLPSLAPGC